MHPVIFLEKVRRPDLRGLVRGRLERQLAWMVAASDSTSLGLVLAPPGSGKTTFLSHLAAAVPEPVSWYRAGAEDDDELALTRHLGHTLGAAVNRPEVIEAAAEGRVAALVNALEDPAVPPVQLVIDDLHEIAGTAAERALERFVALRPRKVRIVLGSRRPPRINTSRLLVSGELRQLDGEDLRFRSWEVEELFRTVYDQPLSPEAAAALTRRTGGWAAGLQLFHLAVAGLSRAMREQAVDELSGRSRLIRSYLARNVLEGLAPERRAFLLRTCTLGVLTGDICDDLLDSSGGAAVLAELEAEQFFTTSTDGGLTYHYHQVLQTHLEVLLVDELGSRAARSLYSRAAALLEAAGRQSAAIRAHARAEDWGAVGRLLKPDSPPVTGDEAMWGMLSLPGAPTDDPGLVLAGARRLLRHGLISESVAAYRQAEALLDDPEFRRRCTEERTAAALWLPHAAQPRPGSSRPVQLSAELRQITREVRHPEEHSHGLVRGLATMLTGDLPGAAWLLLVADPEPESAWEPLARRLAGQLVELLDHPAAHAAGRFEEIVLSADVDGWPWLARLARGLQASMMLACEPTPWRVAAAQDLLDDLDHQGDLWSICLTSLAIGWALQISGHDEQALVALRRAEAVAGDLGAPVLQAWSAALRLRVELHRSTGDALESARAETAALHRWCDGLGLARAAVLLRADAGAAGDAGRPVPAARPPASADPAPGPPRLSCLGGFSLTVEGREVPWRNRRPRVRALLMLLALRHGRHIHREELVDALWPDATLASGIRGLQVAVSTARHCLIAGGLAEDCLRRHGDAYALELPGVVDQRAGFEQLVHEAERAQAGGRARDAFQAGRAALDLYVGDLLPEVGPAEWVVEERARLRLLAARAGAGAAKSALQLGELAAGIRAARRSIELDPYHDSSWTLLVELTTRSGDHSAAAMARREHARVRADLGVGV
jgi:DNA-binding SARP family transcriptional activator